MQPILAEGSLWGVLLGGALAAVAGAVAQTVSARIARHAEEVAFLRKKLEETASLAVEAAAWARRSLQARLGTEDPRRRLIVLAALYVPEVHGPAKNLCETIDRYLAVRNDPGDDEVVAECGAMVTAASEQLLEEAAKSARRLNARLNRDWLDP